MGPSIGSAACVVVLARGASDTDRHHALRVAREIHAGASLAVGAEWSAIVVGDGVIPVNVEPLRRLSMVERVVPVADPYRLASRAAFGCRLPVPIDAQGEISSGAAKIGGEAPIALMIRFPADGGPQQRIDLALAAAGEGAALFDAGRISRRGGGSRHEDPLSALGELRAASHRAGMAIAVEVSDPAEIDVLSGLADVLQVGSRNMQDFSLLHALGRQKLPALLKRGPGATTEEFLLAAEYVLASGNGRVILCESGIRSFDSGDQLRLQISAIPVLRGATHLPVMVDLSAAIPDSRLIPPVARAAIAAGADGVILEVTPQEGEPSGSAIPLMALKQLIPDLRMMAQAVGRVV